MSTEQNDAKGATVSRVKRLIRAFQDLLAPRTTEPQPDEDFQTTPAPSVFASLTSEGEVTPGSTGPRTPGEEARFASTIWRLGRQDGELGQSPEDAEQVLRSKTALDWIERRSHAQAAIHAKEAALRQVNIRKADYDLRITELRAQRWKHSDDPLLPPHSRFAPVPWLYIVVGLFAFLAEFPLAVTLINRGLLLKVDELKLISERSTIALAVVLCIIGIAAKIAYDGAKHLLEATRDPQNGLAVDRIVRQKRQLRLLFISINLVLLVCCVGSMIQIANLRIRVETETRLQDIPPEIRTPDETKSLEDARRDRAAVAGRTFFWLTITLPLFGAVSWITGSATLQQQRQDRHTYRAVQQVEQAAAKCAAEAATLDHEIASAKQRLEDETGPDGIKEALLKTRLDVFQHGYHRGAILPAQDATTTLYALHVAALKRLAYRRIRTHATRTIPTNG